MNNPLTPAQQIAVLAAAGINATLTKPTSGQWVDMGGGVYIAGNGPTEGLTDQQFNFAADVMDPNSNPDSLVRHAQSIGVSLAGTALDTLVPPTQPTFPATSSGGATIATYTPTPFTAQGSGVTDPFQPVGQGFGTDYGLPTSDPNFAFGNPSGGQTVPTTGVSPAQQTGQQPLVEPTPGSGTTAVSTAQDANQASTGRTAVMNNRPAGTVYYPSAVGAEQVVAPSTGITGTVTQQRGTRLAAAAQPAAQPVYTVPGATSPQQPAATAATATGSAAQNNALTDLQTTLNTYGLGSLTNWAWSEIVNGASEAQVLLDLYQQPAFKQAFPEIAARQQAGLPALSPGDIVNYRNQATQIMKAAGLPSGFWDQPADFTSLLGNDVSLAELNQRVSLAQQAAYQVPGDVRAMLTRDYGVGAGQLAAFFLDPKTAEPLIQRDFMAAQIGGAASRTGYGSTKTQDEMLTDLGVNPAQAQQGFTSLTQQRQLFSSLPGENTTGISRDDQLAAQFGGNSLAQEAITRRAQQRAAQFAGGGGFSSSQSGFGGIGQAQSA